MKRKFIILFILISISLFASAQNKEGKKTINKVKSISIETSEKSEINSINWDEIRQQFSVNSPTDSISIRVTFLKGDGLDSKKIKKSIHVSGIQSNIEELIATANKMIDKFLSENSSVKN